MHIFVVKHPSAPTSTILVLQFTIIQILKQKSSDKWGTPGSAYHVRDTREAWEWGYGNVDGMPIFVWVLISTPCSGCNLNRCSYSWCLWMYVGIPWVCGDTRSMWVGRYVGEHVMKSTLNMYEHKDASYLFHSQRVHHQCHLQCQIYFQWKWYCLPSA